MAEWGSFLTGPEISRATGAADARVVPRIEGSRHSQCPSRVPAGVPFAVSDDEVDMKLPSVRQALLMLVLLAPSNVSAQENLNFRPPQGWTPGNVQETKDQLLMELVKAGETVANWTELLTVQQFRRSSGSPSPREFYDQLRAVREARCPGVSEWRIVAEETATVLYEWNTSGPCDSQPAQWEIARLIFAQKTGYRVAYTTRTQPTAEVRSTWTDWLQRLSLGR